MAADNETLIDRLLFCRDLHERTGYPENSKLFGEAAAALEASQREADARVRQAVKDEREACAKIVDGEADKAHEEANDFRLSEVEAERSDTTDWLRTAATAIRSQGGAE